MQKAKFFIGVEQAALDKFKDVAEANHLSPHQFAGVIIGKFGELKPELALSALASIPQEYFKRGPGRPLGTGTASGLRRNSERVSA